MVTLIVRHLHTHPSKHWGQDHLHIQKTIVGCTLKMYENYIMYFYCIGFHLLWWKCSYCGMICRIENTDLPDVQLARQQTVWSHHNRAAGQLEMAHNTSCTSCIHWIILFLILSPIWYIVHYQNLYCLFWQVEFVHCSLLNVFDYLPLLVDHPVGSENIHHWILYLFSTLIEYLIQHKTGHH